MGTEHSDVYKQIAALARQMTEQLPDNSVRVFDELLANAVKHIPGAQYAGITIVARREEVATPVATHEHARTIDSIQEKLRQGPCFDAATEHDSYFINDLQNETRWPDFRVEALEQTRIRSVASFDLFTTRDTVGALNLYSEDAGAFDQEARDLGYIFAAHAAIVWAAVRRGEQFRSALASRDVIGQAKGMIMERFSVDAIDAFEMLRTLSQNENIRLAEVARRLVDADHPPDYRRHRQP